MPDVKIRAAQQNTTNKVWPISGWAIKSEEIIDIKIIDISCKLSLPYTSTICITGKYLKWK